MMTDGRAALMAKHSEMARERFMRTLSLMHVWLDYNDVTVVASVKLFLLICLGKYSDSELNSFFFPKANF